MTRSCSDCGKGDPIDSAVRRAWVRRTLKPQKPQSAAGRLIERALEREMAL